MLSVEDELEPIVVVWQAASVAVMANAQAIRSERVDKGKDDDMVCSTYINDKL